MSNKYNFENEEVLIYDIETATTDTEKPDPEVDKLKLFGYYSYKIGKYGIIPYTDKTAIQKMIDNHKFMVGFNNIEYDDIILKKFGISLEYKRIIDMQRIFKKRASGMITKKGMLSNELMKYSLDYITRFLELVDDTTAKDEIDYKIFKKDVWTADDVKKMREYTFRDLEITKKLYEWLQDYFESFKDFLPKNDVDKKYYLSDTIAKFSYKALCHALGWEPVFDSDAFKENESDEEPESIAGGYVAYPAGERFEGNIFCLDFSSLYPHIMIQCNLYGRNKQSGEGWHGSGVWNVEGFYDDKELSKQCELIKSLYFLRLFYKRNFVLVDTGKVISMKFAKDFIGQKYYNVHRDSDGKIHLEINVINEDTAKEFVTLFEGGPDPREYTVKIIINTCFSEDTEIITTKGIKLIKDCKKGDMVYSINKETGKTEIKEIIDTQTFDYNEEMLNFKTQSMDLLVTPDHDMIHTSKKNDAIITIKANELYDKSHVHYPKTKPISNKKDILFDFSKYASKDSIWSIKLDNPYSERKNTNLEYLPNRRCHLSLKGYDAKLKGRWFIQGRKRDMCVKRVVNIKDLMYFIGIYVAEGCYGISLPRLYENGNVRGKTYCIHIAQKEKNVIIKTKIRDVLNRLGFRFSEDKNGFSISSKFLYDFITQFGKGSKNLSLPDWIFDYDASILEHLYDGLYDGDGTKAQNKYTTSSIKLRDDYIRLNLHLGYRCTYLFDEKYGKCWRIVRFKQTQNIPKNNVKIKNISSKVVCVTVEDNHTVLAGRNGKFQWVGQCYGLLNNAYYKLVYDMVAGGDCTRIGRQWTKYARKKFKEFGYNVIYTDTDSVYLIDVFNDKQKLLDYKQSIIEDIKKTVPFPQSTFDMGIDAEIKYIFFFKNIKSDDKETDIEMDEDDFLNKPLGLMKKNYIYVTKKDKLVLKNLGIKKKNISALSKEIFFKHMVPIIIKEGRVKFAAVEIENLMRKLLTQNIELAYMRKNIAGISAYKKSMTGIQAQISLKYGPGIHFMIPNKRGIGVGKKIKYCSAEEFKKYKMEITDIDFDMFWHELNYFIKEQKQVTLFDMIARK